MKLSLSRSFLWSLFLVSSWICISPGLGDGQLWATGAIEYQLPLSLSMVGFAFIIRSRWLVSLPFLVIAATMHELIAFALAGACASLLWMRRRDRKRLAKLALITALTMGLAAFVVMAPGNTKRATLEQRNAHHISIPNHLVSVIWEEANFTAAGVTAGLLLFLAGSCAGEDRSNTRLLDLIGWPILLAGLTLATSFVPMDRVSGRILDLL
ncbi:MAG: DUF6056 family protein [Terracidiphilus sp.]